MPVIRAQLFLEVAKITVIGCVNLAFFCELDSLNPGVALFGRRAFLDYEMPLNIGQILYSGNETITYIHTSEIEAFFMQLVRSLT